MTRLQDHNALRWQDKPGTWTSRESTDHEHLQQRVTSIVVTPPTAAEARAAALVICGHATSAADARELLDMCGLLGAGRG